MILAGALTALVSEATGAPLKTVPDLLPQPFDHAGVVVTVAEIVIQSGETMILACLLHLSELPAVKFVPVNRAPVVSRGIHRGAWSHSAISADDHVILTGTAVPVSKPQAIALIANDSRHSGEQFLAAVAGAIAVPADLAKVQS